MGNEKSLSSIELPDIEEYKRDPYKAAAAAGLGKPIYEVTPEERHRYKIIVMSAIYGRRFHLGLRPDGDDFESMYSRQRLFTMKFLKSRGLSLDDLSEQDRTDLTREYLLSLHAELTEILQCTDWKKHRSQPDSKNYAGVKEEIIDVQKFLWGLSIIWAITEGQFVQIFLKKSAIVEGRFEQELLRKAQQSEHPSTDD